MKKFRISILLVVAIIGTFLYSCIKDDFNEKNAMELQVQLDKQRQLDQDSLNTKSYRISYTINLVDASTSALKSSSLVSAIAGATVKFVQGDTIIVRTADASGIVAIGNVKPGLANVNITLPAYSEVNYTVNLSSSSYSGGRQVSNIIPLIPITGTATGTIQGRVTCESDLTNKTVEAVPTGTKILAMVRTSSAALPSTGSNNIVSISYDKLSLQTTTEANGNYSLTVPATVSGLEYDIIVSDFTVTQKLLQGTYFNVDTLGVLDIATNFGSSYQTASSVSAGTPVIITVGAPDYTFTEAKATAVIDNSNGINNIQITNNGGSYSNPSTTYKVSVNSPLAASTSKAIATLTLSSGRVSAISVTTPGSQYPLTAENAAFSIPYVYDDVRAGVATVNGGGIATLNIPANRRGVFYNTDTANVLQTYTINGSGAGARVTFNFQWNANGYWEVGSATVVTNPTGSGYAVGDTIGLRVRSGKAQYMAGNLHMTSGSVTAISVSDQGANYISGKVDVVLSAPTAGGTTAVANAPTVVNGKITAITLSGVGSGYISAPTVTIVNKVEKSQAKFAATLTGGKVTAITPASSGNGYLTVPSVSITSAIPGAGSGASVYATISGGAVSLTLVNQGGGYTGNNPAAAKNFSGTTNLTVTGNSNTIINIDLGTGKRTIEQ